MRTRHLERVEVDIPTVGTMDLVMDRVPVVGEFLDIPVDRLCGKDNWNMSRFKVEKVIWTIWDKNDPDGCLWATVRLIVFRVD